MGGSHVHRELFLFFPGGGLNTCTWRRWGGNWCQCTSINLIYSILSIITPTIPQFATYPAHRSPVPPRLGVMESRRGEAVKRTAALRLPPRAPER